MNVNAKKHFTIMEVYANKDSTIYCLFYCMSFNVLISNEVNDIAHSKKFS